MPLDEGHNRWHLGKKWRENEFLHSNDFYLQEIHKLETDLGHFQQKWKAVWDKLDLPTGKRETMQRNLSFNTQIVKSHGRSIHKRSTLEILVKGKMLGEAAKMFSQPHRFEKHTYTTPAYCDYCGQVLWGLLKTGGLCSSSQSITFISHCYFIYPRWKIWVILLLVLCLESSRLNL